MKSHKKPKSNVVSTKPLRGAGSEPVLSAKIGGVSNKSTPTSSYPKGK